VNLKIGMTVYLIPERHAVLRLKYRVWGWECRGPAGRFRMENLANVYYVQDRAEKSDTWATRGFCSSLLNLLFLFDMYLVIKVKV
jgi:hypothetical protein